MMMSSVLVSMMISQFKVVIQSRRWDHGGPRMQARDVEGAAAIRPESDRRLGTMHIGTSGRDWVNVSLLRPAALRSS